MADSISQLFERTNGGALSRSLGGSNNLLGLYNGYNRTAIRAICLDSNTTLGFVTPNVWQPADGGGSNTKYRISFLDGLGQSFLEGNYMSVGGTYTTGSNAKVGVNLNSTTATPRGAGDNQFSNGAMNVIGTDSFNPVLGFNYIQAMELGGAGSGSFFNYGNSSYLTIKIDM